MDWPAGEIQNDNRGEIKRKPEEKDLQEKMWMTETTDLPNTKKHTGLIVSLWLEAWALSDA